MTRLEIGRAFRWTPAEPCTLDDRVRVIAGGVAIANGYDGGFSSCWAAGSRLLLDLVESGLRFEEIAASFVARAAALRPDLDDGPPGGSLLVARIGAGQVELEHAGEHAALVVRDGAVAARAVAHTLREQLRLGWPDEELGAVPDVLARCIGAGQPLVVGRMSASVAAGDVVVIADRRVLDDAGEARVAALAGEGMAAQALAERLVEAGRRAHATAAVVRLR